MLRQTCAACSSLLTILESWSLKEHTSCSFQKGADYCMLDREEDRGVAHLFQPPRADQMPDADQGRGFHKSPNKALRLG